MKLCRCCAARLRAVRRHSPAAHRRCHAACRPAASCHRHAACRSRRAPFSCRPLPFVFLGSQSEELD